jgi:hypothetical protein
MHHVTCGRIGGVELVLRQAAISARLELDGLLRLDERPSSGFIYIAQPPLYRDIHA